MPFLDLRTDPDQLHDMIVFCLEEGSRSKAAFKLIVRKRIEELIREKKRVDNHLYNPYRNISLNQCCGDSKTPASEWLNLSGKQEWEDY